MSALRLPVPVVAPAPSRAPAALRAERPGDAAAREALLDLAMGPNRTRKSSEAIRRGRLPAEGLAFAAENGAGELVGTVRLWDVLAGATAAGAPVPALLLGPLAVDPAFEGQGVGSALTRRVLAEARRLGHGAVVLVGDAPYYERFGFRAGPAAALAMPGPFERHRFLALELRPGALAGAAGLVAPAGRLSFGA